MVNQYVRLKTIGQGSHGKVWLCAEPTLRETDDDEEEEREERKRGKERSQWEEEEGEEGDVKYCAIKSVAREGVGRGKSLKAAKGRKVGGSSTGIGADDKVKREVAIMKRLDHKNVVRLKEVIDDVKSKKVFMGAFLFFSSGEEKLTRGCSPRVHGGRSDRLARREQAADDDCRRGASDFSRRRSRSRVS